jgi:O-antigen/teichoic acid export membrane protein
MRIPSTSIEFLNRLRNSLILLRPGVRTVEYRRSLANSFANTVEGLVTPLLWLASTPIFLSHLGADIYGLWMLLNAIVGAGGMMGLGITDATVKFTSKYRALKASAEVNRVIQGTCAIYLSLGVAAALAVVVLSPFLASSLHPGNPSEELVRDSIIVSAFCLFARFIDSIFSSVMYGFERYDLVVKVNLAATAASTAVTVLLASMGRPLPILLGVTAVFLAAAGLLKLFLLKRLLCPTLSLVPYCSRATFIEFFHFGAYTWLASMAGILNSYLDRFLLATYLNTSVLAYYVVSVQLVTQVHSLLTRACAFLFPYSGLLFERKDYTRLKSAYERMSGLVLTLSSSAIVPIYLFAPDILEIWLGPQQSDISTFVIRILAFRFAVLPLGIVNHNFMLGAGLVKLSTSITVAVSITTISATIVLVPDFGAAGAAVAQLFAIPFMLGTRFIIERRLFGESSLSKNLIFLALPLSILGITSLIEKSGIIPNISPVFLPVVFACATLTTGFLMCVAVAFVLPGNRTGA